MRYDEMLAALAAASRFGVRLDLGPTEAALARLGHPERRLGWVVQVGGTNGKGLTSAFLEAALRDAGVRTGLFTSPHLSRFTERIRIAGAEVARDRVAERFARVATVVADLDLTFFELATVVGMLSFAEEGVEATVLEVGLGGRLDATSAALPAVAVVTGVALDHQEVLGPDPALIAREKAGIFKPGRPAVIGLSGEAEAVPVLIAEATRRGAQVVLVPNEAPTDWTLGLAGAHQRRNAASVMVALDELARRGGPVVDEATRRRAFQAVRWPGRMERIGNVLLDAAHNPQGAAALAAALPDDFVAVVAMSADKDAAATLAPMLARARRVFVTEAPSPRALRAAELAEIARRVAPGCEISVMPDPHAALAAAQDGGLVVAFGSLFLIGALRARMLGEELDPLPVQDPAARRPA